jgi:DtxR family Mn-dependent transcriptional regulator
LERSGWRCAVNEQKLSAAMEDYLKAIYLLCDEGREVSTALLAERLGVAAPSVTSMVKRLHGLGLVAHSPYRGIALTAGGLAAAVEVVRHHRLIELYLSEFLDVPWDKVHDEAERLEHVLSEELESRMAEKLGEPSVDPHGDPIPTREGMVSDLPTVSLWEAAAGSVVVVARVSDRDPNVLAHLLELNLVPGADAEVMEVSPYSRTMTLRTVGNTHVIGAELARGIRVRVQVPELTGERSR